MRSRVYFLIICWCATLEAADLNRAYQEGTQTASQHANQSIDLLQSLNLAQFPGYQPQVAQEHYYQGVTQKGTSLESDAQKPNELNQAVQQSFNQMPLYQINTQSHRMQQLNEIAEHGQEIIQGKNTTRTTCSLQPKQCQYSWQRKNLSYWKAAGPSQLHPRTAYRFVTL